MRRHGPAGDESRTTRFFWNHGFVMQVLAWLLVGYSDGVIFKLMEETEINGYLVFLIPVVLLYLAGLFVKHRVRVSERLIKRQVFVAALLALASLVHAISVGSFHIDGLLQLFAMVALILLFTDLFADNSDLLRPGFNQAMSWVHWIVCGYIVLAWLVMRLWEVDISLSLVSAADLAEGSVHRPSGLHREAAWAGYAAATSYLAVHLTRRKGLLFEQIALLAAIATAAAGSGLILAALLVGHQIVTSRNLGAKMRIALVIGIGVMALSTFSARIAGVLNNADPSALMRIESAIVASEVIGQTFPIGTGYGNYRDVADFDEDLWRGFIDLEEADYYKSDILVLNLTAELGLLGVLIVGLLIGNFAGRGRLLPACVVVVMMMTSGTLIMPFYLVLAATAGLEIARLRAGRPARATQ